MRLDFKDRWLVHNLFKNQIADITVANKVVNAEVRTGLILSFTVAILMLC